MTELENTTNTAAAATLTEKELWAQFLDTTIKTSIKVGAATLKGEIEPFDLIYTGGEYQITHDFAEAVTDELKETETPADDLETLIGDIEGYLLNLKFLRDKFAELKQEAFIFPEQPDEDVCSEEEYGAWENAAIAAEANPRYRAIAEHEQEAA